MVVLVVVHIRVVASDNGHCIDPECNCHAVDHGQVDHDQVAHAVADHVSTMDDMLWPDNHRVMDESDAVYRNYSQYYLGLIQWKTVHYSIDQKNTFHQCD